MKKADREKIDAIGMKLEIDTSGTNQKKEYIMWKSLYSIPHRLIAGIIYIFVQVLVFFLTWVSGDSSRPIIGGYPYHSPPSFTTRIIPELIFASVIHTGNGFFLLPDDTQLLPKRIHRSIIFLGNLALSFTVFLLAASASPVYISNIAYGVYDNHQQVRLFFRRNLIENNG